MSHKKRLRLVAVAAQFEFVVDDGETLTPFVLTDREGRVANPSTRILAKDWPDYAKTGFIEAIKDLETQLEAQEKKTST
jgi:hypothetical protein